MILNLKTFSSIRSFKNSYRKLFKNQYEGIDHYIDDINVEKREKRRKGEKIKIVENRRYKVRRREILEKENIFY